VKEEIVTGKIKDQTDATKVLRRHFPECFDKNGDFDFEKFRRELSAKAVDFSKESYSLEWLGKSYARLLATEETETLLRENKAFNERPENAASHNVLIKGDNLDVLKHLAGAYREQVKMIYIDPPYNTGSDGFVYRDDRRFSVQELMRLAGIDEERAKRILDFVQSGSNSHSAWLTFMYPRLYIARHLLREDGVIYVSIDDNEAAQLRILMDEVFGEDSYVATFPWKKRTAKSDVPYGVSQDYEWIICYAKRNFQAGIYIERKYYQTDDYPNDRWRLSDLTSPKTPAERPNSAFTMINPKNGKKYPCGEKRVWGVTKETFDDYYKKGKIVFPGDYEFLNIEKPAYRVFESEDREKAIKKFGKDISIKTVSTMLPKSVGMTKEGNKEIIELFREKVFDNAKPTQLIQYLLQFSTSDGDLILDFFAGSGTTGDAVMRLNAEDGGKRRYILVQLPEPIDPKKNKTAYDFVKNELGVEEPTIFDITRERLIRAARKIRQEHPESDFDGGFRIFETMPLPETYRMSVEALSKEASLPFDDALTRTLLLTWKTYDGVPLDEEAKAVDLVGYRAYLAGSKLYLMDGGFGSKHFKALLEKMDDDPDFNPHTIVAFGYRFESKVLRELAENLKSYDYKKGGGDSIEFVTRY